MVPPRGTLAATGTVAGIPLDETDAEAYGILTWDEGLVLDEYMVHSDLPDEDMWIEIFFNDPADFTVGAHSIIDGYSVTLDAEYDGDIVVDSADATSGVVVISSAAANNWVADYDLQFSGGHRLAGSFDVPVLPTEGGHDGNPRCFYGEYHRVSIYSRALTEAEVRILYKDNPK